MARKGGWIIRATHSALYLMASVMGFGPAVQAQDMTLGEIEYLNSCVACHGISGKGDGPVAGFLSSEVVPDLTALQSKNGGMFPVATIYEIIDGGEVANVHGTREMPIWGARFRERATKEDVSHYSSISPEGYAETRVLGLIAYLVSIQVK